ncbi:MAG: glycosyltransferase family 1 protein [Candidatus Saccharimonadales bacterium]
MKIVIDARESGTSTGRYTDKLIEHMYRLRPNHEIVVLTKAHRLKFFKDIAPTFKVIESPYKEFTFDEQLALKKQLDSLAADLVHFSMVQQPVRYRGKTVTTMHDLTTIRFRNPDKNPIVYFLKQKVYAWVNKKAARKAAAVITPTQFVKDDVAKFTKIKPSKITVTYESADAITEPAEPVNGLENAQYIMYVGRPTPHKNLERLIEAFVDIQKTKPDLKLVLAGKKDANYDRIEQSVIKKGIQNIIFTGFISDGQLRWLYEQTAAYVFPSLSEGFGLPGLEAMVHDAPVVSSDATCLPEVYGEAAHYFKPLDVADMAAKITEVIDDEELRQKLIALGRAQTTKYSWRRTAEQTLAIYDRVLNNIPLEEAKPETKKDTKKKPAEAKPEK